VELIKRIARENGNGGRKRSADIYKFLRKHIEDNLLGDEKLPSIREMSEGFGANYRTVRSALTKLNEEGLILYEQNSGTIINKRLAIAYVRWEGNAFCGAISEGVRRYCENTNGGHDLVILDAMKNHQRLLDGLASVSHSANGILMMPFEMEEYRHELQKLVDDGVKIVLLDRTIPGIDNISSVTCDDFGGAYQAVDHLLTAHKKPIYYLGQTEAPSSCKNRHLGWLSAMNEHGYFDTDKYCVGTEATEGKMSSSRPFAIAELVASATNLFEEHQEDIYCIFTSNDYEASAVYKAAAKKNLQVGKDVFVAGFGNMPLSENLTPKLTTVEQTPEKLGFEGSQILKEMIDGNIDAAIHRILPVNLIVRESSLPK
jgi:DNA-binding LacI/PurR family transcriptional regulator